MPLRTPETKLSTWQLPHLDVILDEIFYVPPAALFPDMATPQTLGDLAERSGMPLYEVASRLDLAQQMSEHVEISGQELNSLLQLKTPLLLLDVRLEWEYAHCHLPGSVLLTGANFPELWPQMLERPHVPVICICHHGIRSYSAALFLREKGVQQARSLKGGLDAWAQTIAPGMPRY